MCRAGVIGPSQIFLSLARHGASQVPHGHGHGTERVRAQAVCPNCGGTVIEYDAAAGSGFCVGCGTVVEESAIVSEVTFGETSAGAAMVQGSYVAAGASPCTLSARPAGR
jgi:ribosomal protein L37AE/L43A